MYPLVPCQIATTVERLITNVVRVRFLFYVCPSMDRQTEAFVEWFIANITDVRLLPGMFQLV